MGLTLLAQAHLPLTYWVEAFQTAVYLINRLPTPVLDNSTPLFQLLKEKPDYKSLQVFGCACLPCLKPYNQHKLQFHSKNVFIWGLHHSKKDIDVSVLPEKFLYHDMLFLIPQFFHVLKVS